MLVTVSIAILLMTASVLPQPPVARTRHACAPGRPLLRVEARIPGAVEREKAPPPPMTEPAKDLPAPVIEDGARRALEEGDLMRLSQLLQLFVECRQVRIREEILRGIATAKVETRAIDWVWLQANCPRGAEGVAVRIALAQGLDRYGGERWKERIDDPEIRRDVEEALAAGK